MKDEKKIPMELSLDDLDKIAGGDIEEDATVVTVVALKTINAANGPGEVGEMGHYGPIQCVAVFPAGSEIKVYIDYQMNGYVYSNTDINPLGGGYKYFYVNLNDVQIKR